MTPCERFKDKIFDFIDQELDDASRAEIQQHIDNCPLCAKFYQGLRSLKQGLKQMKPVEAPDSFQIVLRERIRHEMANKKGFGLSPSPSHWPRWIFATVMLSVVVFAFIMYFNPLSRPLNAHDQLVPIIKPISNDVDLNRVQYVIDDLGFSESSSLDHGRMAMSKIDSLLTDESSSEIVDYYQPVRF